MGASSYLKIDVNGQEVFWIDKTIVTGFSAKLLKLFEKSTSEIGKMKLIFHDFPGGAEAFELIARFCYNKGRAEITPSNVFLLNYAANFMEMNFDNNGTTNLVEQTEKSLQGISFWTWADLVVALKKCQDLYPSLNSSTILENFMEAVVDRLGFTNVASSCTSSSDSSGLRASCDTRSTLSLKDTSSRTWWFEDLEFLSFDLLDRLIKTMISQKFDHAIMSRFLFFYQKSRFSSTGLDEKCKIVEDVVSLLSLVDWNYISCKSLFDLLRVSSGLKLSKFSKNKLEKMIGLQLDQANLDDLLVPSPNGKSCIYDVNLVLRLLNVFCLESGRCIVFSLSRMKKVGSLIDLYTMEVAPDSSLRPSKFADLAMALPDSARDHHDGIYQAMDMYLEVHSSLSEEERTKICSALNYDKLSPDSLKHLEQNSKFPPRSAIEAFSTQHTKSKSLFHGVHSPKSLRELSFSDIEYEAMTRRDHVEQIFSCKKKLDFSVETLTLEASFRETPRKANKSDKLPKKHRRWQSLLKSRLSYPKSARALVKLCR
ncbi:NPH3 domain [Dillenia turbinata]|uniref:NPH3 domain n=1 Tax=Dillenia turbinata TaxID=194707 RepID=A0AAN8UNF7_9MAGN